MTLVALLFLPLLIPFVAKFFFRHTITWIEMGIQLAVILVLVTGCYALSKARAKTDMELVSGEVVKKQQEKVSCSHSYQCRCRTVTRGSGKNTYTTTECDTCYEHSYDYDWAVYADHGMFESRYEIDRVDRQGKSEPPRWTAVQMGEPTASWHEFTNYIQLAPSSLFNEQKYSQDITLEYPRIYDYYHVDRALGTAPDLKDWSRELEHMHKKLGPEAKANLLVVFSNVADPAWSEGLRQKWLGGKKNDVILVLGTPQYPTLSWARVISWSENPMINSKLRDDIELAYQGKPLDGMGVLKIADENIRKHFQRMDVEKYAYLEDDYEPPTWLLIVCTLLGLGAAVGTTWFFHHEDIC